MRQSQQYNQGGREMPITYHCDKCKESSFNRNDIKDYYFIIQGSENEYGLMLCSSCIQKIEAFLSEKTTELELPKIIKE